MILFGWGPNPPYTGVGGVPADSSPRAVARRRPRHGAAGLADAGFASDRKHTADRTAHPCAPWGADEKLPRHSGFVALNHVTELWSLASGSQDTSRPVGPV
jgi:hypothetical protein